MESAITSKGQVTIPKEARERLGISAGDKVKFFFQPDGNLVILPKLPITAIKGMLHSKRGPISQEEMDAAIAEGATARYKRFLRQ